MWVYATYEPVSAFGLRPSNTTSSGGKSLVCPTPYGVKMALLDRLIRERGLDQALSSFYPVRDLSVWLRACDVVTVNRTFQRVLRPRKSELNEATGRMEVWTRTIAQREYCFFAGEMTLALGADDAFADELPALLSGINYFGRRGSFMQMVACVQSHKMPDAGYVNLQQPPSPDQLGFGFLQRMDDMRSDAEFEDVDVVAGKRGDGGRQSYTVVVPYELRQHASNHTVYSLQGVTMR